MAALFRAYSRQFERRPYITLLVANGVLMSIGDISAQTLGSFGSALPMVWDASRTMRYAVFGASMGPLGGAWNKFLEVKFPLRSYAAPGAPIPMTKVKVEASPIPGFALPKGSRLERGPGAAGVGGGAAGVSGDLGEVSVVQLAKRVGADQLGMAPVSLFIFLMSISLLEGLEPDEIREKIRTNYLPILLVNWQVWPILQLINFRYVPLKYRVPFGSICGIAWTCFLSSRTSAVDTERMSS